MDTLARNMGKWGWFFESDWWLGFAVSVDFQRESRNEEPELSSVGSTVVSERFALGFFLVRSVRYLL